MDFVLTPAYGRDYKTQKEAVTAYFEGKDWVLHNPTSRYDGKYCSCRDFAGQTVTLRYNKNQQLTVVKTPPRS